MAAPHPAAARRAIGGEGQGESGHRLFTGPGDERLSEGSEGLVAGGFRHPGVAARYRAVPKADRGAPQCRYGCWLRFLRPAAARPGQLVVSVRAVLVDNVTLNPTGGGGAGRRVYPDGAELVGPVRAVGVPGGGGAGGDDLWVLDLRREHLPGRARPHGGVGRGGRRGDHRAGPVDHQPVVQRGMTSDRQIVRGQDRRGRPRRSSWRSAAGALAVTGRRHHATPAAGPGAADENSVAAPADIGGGRRRRRGRGGGRRGHDRRATSRCWSRPTRPGRRRWWTRGRRRRPAERWRGRSWPPGPRSSDATGGPFSFDIALLADRSSRARRRPGVGGRVVRRGRLRPGPAHRRPVCDRAHGPGLDRRRVAADVDVGHARAERGAGGDRRHPAAEAAAALAGFVPPQPRAGNRQGGQ